MKKLIVLLGALSIQSIYAAWTDIESIARYAVIQIINYSNQPNLCEPFKPSYEEQCSGGSGFFINEEGEFITNYHVIQGSRRLYIMMPSINSTARFEAELVGCKPERDVALCRLTTQGKEKFKKFLETVPGCNGMIQYLELASDNYLEPVQEVMALGFPKLDGFKRTIGHINGLSLQSESLYCQISAPINEGNSGGPTVNAHGKVVGINTAGIKGANLIGFMVPVAHFRNSIASMRTHRVLTASLDFRTQQTSANILERLHCKMSGALVSEALIHNRFNVQPYDIITHINDHAIDNNGMISVDWIDSKVPFESLIEELTIGQEVTLQIWRNNEAITSTQALTPSSIATIDMLYPESGNIPYAAFGGIVLQPLKRNHFALVQSSQQNPNLDLLCFLYDYKNTTEDRLIISKVYPNSQAEHESALAAGTILEKVNGIPVKTFADLKKALSDQSSEYILIETLHGGVAALHIETVIQEDNDLRQLHGYDYYQLS